jgi:hypothetical protein
LFAYALALYVFYFSRSPSFPFPPHLSLLYYASRIPSWYIHGHLCLRACSQKWIAHDRRASERANSPLFSFLLAYSVRVSWMCTHTYAFSGFFSLFLSFFLFLRPRRRMRRRYIISSSQLSSSSSTSLYFYLLFIDEWKTKREREREKKGEYQVIGQGRIYITTLFLSLVLSSRRFITYADERKREKRKKKRKRKRIREEYIHLQSTICIEPCIYIYHDEKPLQNSV